MITCPLPATIENAVSSSSSFTLETVVVYDCLFGFWFSDQTKRQAIVCEDSGSWNTTVSMCQRELILQLIPNIIIFANVFWYIGKTFSNLRSSILLIKCSTTGDFLCLNAILLRPSFLISLGYHFLNQHFFPTQCPHFFMRFVVYGFCFLFKALFNAYYL